MNKINSLIHAVCPEIAPSHSLDTQIDPSFSGEFSATASSAAVPRVNHLPKSRAADDSRLITYPNIFSRHGIDSGFNSLLRKLSLPALESDTKRINKLVEHMTNSDLDDFIKRIDELPPEKKGDINCEEIKTCLRCLINERQSGIAPGQP